MTKPTTLSTAAACDASTTKTTTTTTTCSLVPIKLSNADEVEELRQQRIVCGWDYGPDSIALWKQKQESGLKSFFWITIPQPLSSSESSKTTSITNTTTATIRAGHISLDSYCNPPDPDLATVDKTNLTIQTFFILPQYRAGGVGRRAMDLLESMATEEPYGSPACQYITLNTFSKKYFYEDSPATTYIRKVSKFSGHEWYERMGYVAWKEEPRYDYVLDDGSSTKIVAVFMRKKVGKHGAVS